MNTEISRQQWNNFVRSAKGGSFLQSWEWGEVQKELSVPYWRLAAPEGGEIKAVALAVRRELPFGKCWIYVPRGPVFNFQFSPLRHGSAGQAIFNFQNELTKLAREQGAVFIRTEPSEVSGEGWVKADRDVQPANTLVLDLDKSAEELLAEMHPKTRYNIRLAERKGVHVRFSQSSEDLEKFLDVAGDVSARSPFRYHPPEHYRAMLKVLTPAEMMEVAVAEYEGNPLAVHLLVKLGETVTYVHGASSSQQREVMAPHLLQWESIKRAKAQGAKVYDFFGVAPKDASEDHPWSGITRFKEGFGGRRVDYPGAWDLVLDPMQYWLFNSGRKLKKMVNRK